LLASNTTFIACCGAFQVSNVVFLGWTALELTWNAYGLARKAPFQVSGVTLLA